jgi:hypothetical protein
MRTVIEGPPGPSDEGEYPMIAAFSLWSILALASSLLLVAGACALAVWAARQHDSQSELIEKLTGKQRGTLRESPTFASRKAPEINKKSWFFRKTKSPPGLNK